MRSVHCAVLLVGVALTCLSPQLALAQQTARTKFLGPDEYRLRALLEAEFDSYLQDCGSSTPGTDSPIPARLWRFDAAGRSLPTATALAAPGFDPLWVFQQVFASPAREGVGQLLAASQHAPLNLDRQWLKLGTATPVSNATDFLQYHGTCRDYVSTEVQESASLPWLDEKMRAKLQDSTKAALAFAIGHFVSPAQILEDKTPRAERTELLFRLWHEYALRKDRLDARRWSIRDFYGVPVWHESEESHARSLEASANASFGLFKMSVSAEGQYASAATSSIQSHVIKAFIITDRVLGKKVAGAAPSLSTYPVMQMLPLPTPAEIQTELASPAGGASVDGTMSVVALEAGSGKDAVEMHGVPTAVCSMPGWAIQVAQDDNVGELTSEVESSANAPCRFTYAFKGARLSGKKNLRLRLRTPILDAQGKENFIEYPFTRIFDETFKSLQSSVKCDQDARSCTVTVAVQLPAHWSADDKTKCTSVPKISWQCEDASGKAVAGVTVANALPPPPCAFTITRATDVSPGTFLCRSLSDAVTVRAKRPDDTEVQQSQSVVLTATMTPAQ